MTETAAAELDEGLRRQLANLGDREVGGWKVGLTSGRARDSMGPGFRPFGYLLKERIYHAGHVFRLRDFQRVGVENELCFRLKETLTGDVDRADVIKAVECAMPAFEINEPRLAANASAAERLADNLSQYAIVVGNETHADWPRFDFSAIEVTLSHNANVLQTVAARDHIDDHFDSIAALVRQLHRFGRSLNAGSHVITGSYTRHAVTATGLYRGDFDAPFGAVDVEFR